jgi:hypothetical protein
LGRGQGLDQFLQPLRFEPHTGIGRSDHLAAGFGNGSVAPLRDVAAGPFDEAQRKRRSARSRSIVWSVEPPSQMITSSGRRVCAAIESSSAGRLCAS